MLNTFFLALGVPTTLCPPLRRPSLPIGRRNGRHGRSGCIAERRLRAGSWSAPLERARSLMGIALLLALFTGCQQHALASDESESVESYPVASPQVTDTVVEREYVAEIRAQRYAEIRTRIRGIIDEVAVDEGQAVTTGQHLFSIDARHLTQDVAAAKASTAATEAELQATLLDLTNTQLLFDKNVVSEAQLAQAKAKVKALEAKLDELRSMVERAGVELGYARITAPFTGTINRIPKKAGSALSEEELLTTLADTTEVYAYFRVSENDFLRNQSVLQGESAPEVLLKLADGSLFKKPGRIDAMANEFDRETGTITLRARFENEDGLLRHGSSGQVVLKTHLPGAVLVPQASTFEVQGDLFVYAVDEQSIVHARKIVSRVRHDAQFVVESGLTAQDRFVLEGVQRLKDGNKIQIFPARPTPTAG